MAAPVIERNSASATGLLRDHHVGVFWKPANGLDIHLGNNSLFVAESLNAFQTTYGLKPHDLLFSIEEDGTVSAEVDTEIAVESQHPKFTRVTDVSFTSDEIIVVSDRLGDPADPRIELMQIERVGEREVRRATQRLNPDPPKPQPEVWFSRR